MDGAEELLGLSRERGVIPRASIEQRASVAQTYVGYKLVSPGDLVVNKMQAWNGVLAVSGHAGLTSPDYTVLEEISNYWDARYVAHSLRTPEVVCEMHRRSKGIGYGFMRLYTPDLLSLRLPLPSMDRQRRICDFIDAEGDRIGRLIDYKQRFIALLTEKRSALVSHAVTKGLDTSVPMKPSGVEWLGDIPSHWDVVSSKRLFALRKERAREEDEQLTASQAHGVIPQAEFMELEGRRVVQVVLDPGILKHVEPGDFVISMRSFQGGLERSECRGCVSSAYVALQPSAQVHPRFFSHLLKCTSYIQALQSTTNLVRDGQALRFDNFAQVPLPLLTVDEQEAIADFLDDMTKQVDALIDKTRRSIDLLREYRTALISAAVTGQIDIPGTEASEDVA